MSLLGELGQQARAVQGHMPEPVSGDAQWDEPRLLADHEVGHPHRQRLPPASLPYTPRDGDPAVLMGGNKGQERIGPAQRAVDPRLVRLCQRGQNVSVFRPKHHGADPCPPRQPLDPCDRGRFGLSRQVNSDRKHLITLRPNLRRS